MQLEKELNQEQFLAVCETRVPVLALSGAGTGKTRIITYKIAYLIQNHGVFPHKILALTFTNKAAEEMRQRAYALLKKVNPDFPEESLKKMWVGTFHANCARMLRWHCKALDYLPNFTIIDVDDKIKIIKDLIQENNYKHLQKISQVKEDISRAKNNFLEPEDIRILGENQANLYFIELSSLYSIYQKFLLKNNAMDFDDLIVNMVKLFYLDKEILHFWKENFSYILIDEFQDTNKSQYLLIKLLVGERNNVTFVGDDDQSIYSFRGATIENILSLQKDFPSLKIIKSIHNYRSTPEILALANESIAFNTNRLGKDLVATLPSLSAKPEIFPCEDEKEEAKIIVQQIHTLQSQNPDWNFAIIYRTNAQSRILEKELVEKNIPYTLLGAKSFYDRKEIKDIFAYMRLILNDLDNIALERIINIPHRGIGEVTFNKIKQYATENHISYFQALKNIDSLDISKKIKENLSQFYLMIQELRELSLSKPQKLLAILIESIDYKKYLSELDNEQERIWNVEELMRYYDSYFAEEKDPTFQGFLEQASLLDHSEEADKIEKRKLCLATVHAVKGLEFDVVFIIGLVEEIFPHYLSISTQEELEEERRLFYVAITRAKKRLFLTYPKKIFRNHSYEPFLKSRFLKEISEKNVIIKKEQKNEWNKIKNWSVFS